MADASFALPGPSDPKKRRSENWTDSEILLFITVWGENLEDLRRQKRNSHIYKRIVDQLAMHHIIRTLEDVKNKMKNLQQQYRKEKTKLGSGSSPSTWKFYAAVHAIIGNLPLHDLSLSQESILFSMNENEQGPLNTSQQISEDVTAEMEENVDGAVLELENSENRSPKEIRCRKRKNGGMDERNVMMKQMLASQDAFNKKIESTDKELIQLLKESNELQKKSIETEKEMCAIFRHLSENLNKS